MNVECCIGQLKKRWSLLARKMYYSIEVANKNFYAACVLHNFLKAAGEETELGPYWQAEEI